MTMLGNGDSQTAALTRLVIDGDWACALADSNELRRVCRIVGDEYNDLAQLATETASWADVDIEIASQYWSALALQLRRQHENSRGRAQNPSPSTRR